VADYWTQRPAIEYQDDFALYFFFDEIIPSESNFKPRPLPLPEFVMLLFGALIISAVFVLLLAAVKRIWWLNRRIKPQSNDTINPQIVADNPQKEEEQQQKGFTHVHIYYGSQTGRCKRYAQQLSKLFTAEYTVHDQRDFEPERLLKPTAIPTRLHLFLLSTHTDGTPSDNAKWFYSWLEDFCWDFRVEKDWLSGMRYAVFGAGNSVYGQKNYNLVGKHVDMWLNGLAAQRIWPLTLADEDLQGLLT
jgi:sulfite reductase alpha subunit-like flavoprotein